MVVALCFDPPWRRAAPAVVLQKLERTYNEGGDMFDDSEQVTPRYGEKTITIRLRYFTENLTDKPGTIRRKHAWGQGMVEAVANGSHGISPKDPVPFNNRDEVLVS